MYLDLLEAIDKQIKAGRPHIGDDQISARQQHILYSAVYVQLYNLVEVTVTRCVEAVHNAAADGGRWKPADLSDQLLEEWVRITADTDLPLAAEKRRKRAVALCRHLVGDLPVTWPAGKRPSLGGSWDDRQIERMSERIGCELRISLKTTQAIKRRVRDDLGQLALIRERRNQLAHGDISFAECGAEVTIEDLRRTKECTVSYLQEVIGAFEEHITSYGFLQTNKRPTPDEIGRAT